MLDEKGTDLSGLSEIVLSEADVSGQGLPESKESEASDTSLEGIISTDKGWVRRLLEKGKRFWHDHYPLILTGIYCAGTLAARIIGEQQRPADLGVPFMDMDLFRFPLLTFIKVTGVYGFLYCYKHKDEGATELEEDIKTNRNWLINKVVKYPKTIGLALGLISHSKVFATLPVALSAGNTVYNLTLIPTIADNIYSMSLSGYLLVKLIDFFTGTGKKPIRLFSARFIKDKTKRNKIVREDGEYIEKRFPGDGETNMMRGMFMLEDGKYEEGFSELAKAMEKIRIAKYCKVENRPVMINRFFTDYLVTRGRIGHLLHIPYAKTRARLTPSLEHLIELGIAYHIGSNKKMVKKVFERINRLYPHDINSKVLFASILDYYGDADAKKVHELVYGMMKREVVGETAGKVTVINDSPYIREVYAFKDSSFADAKKTENNLQNAENIIKDHERKEVCKLKHIIDSEKTEPEKTKKENENENRHVVEVYSWSKGKKLLEILETKDERIKEYIAEIVDFLALIHAKMPNTAERKSRKDYIANKLSNPDLGMYVPSRWTLATSYFEDDELDDCFAAADAQYVFNKDAHPEQWLVKENIVKPGEFIIVAIDWEDKGVVPCEFDMVNLLEYGRYFSPDYDFKISALKKYRSAFNHFSGDIVCKSDSRFILRYLNSTFDRAIAFVSAWSSPRRCGMHRKRLDVVDNCLDNIEKIKSEFPGFYRRHEKEYSMRYDGMLLLREGFNR